MHLRRRKEELRKEEVRTEDKKGGGNMWVEAKHAFVKICRAAPPGVSKGVFKG